MKSLSGDENNNKSAETLIAICLTASMTKLFR